MWHDVYKHCGQPRDGIFADFRRNLRGQYHKACMLVLKHESEFRAIKHGRLSQGWLYRAFWERSQEVPFKKGFYSNKVDDLIESDVAGMCAIKFEDLYNRVGFTTCDLQELHSDFNRLIDKCYVSCLHCLHCICVRDVSRAIAKMKGSSSDGSLISCLIVLMIN